jgi:16S rRNA processing protein RimM
VRVVVGRIGRPHGIRGEVTVETRTDEPDERFAAGSVLSVDDHADLVVERSHWHSGRLLVAFVGVHDRNDAEELRNLIVHVDRPADATPDDPEEYYDSTLIGLAVELTDGTALGSIVDVIHLPGQDVLSVRMGERDVLIPFVSSIVPVVDVAQGRVVVNPPEGLLDDDSATDAIDGDAIDGDAIDGEMVD